MLKKALSFVLAVAMLFMMAWSIAPMFGVETRSQAYINMMQQRGMNLGVEQLLFTLVLLAALWVGITVLRILGQPSRHSSHG